MKTRFSKYYTMMFFFFVLLAMVLLSPKGVYTLKKTFGLQQTDLKPQRIVVIDAGHGGFDPGKVGVNDILEKEINLQIAFKVKRLLENNDVKVIMTRQEDIGLYQQTDRNKKSTDMKKRVELINQSMANVAVSIHQNSYPEEYVRGAQVFYHKQSTEGKYLAELMQEQLITTLDNGNKRVEKANDSYYMLKNTTCPIVIVECGFLSNYQEAASLSDENYQEKVAWAIHLAILQYMNTKPVESIS